MKKETCVLYVVSPQLYSGLLTKGIKNICLMVRNRKAYYLENDFPRTH